MEIVDWVQGEFCKKAGESELGRQSRIEKILSSDAKYRAVVKKWERRVGRAVLRMGGWKTEGGEWRLEKELNTIGLVYPWLDAGKDRNKNNVPYY